jgi:hypothetical protein
MTASGLIGLSTFTGFFLHATSAVSKTSMQQDRRKSMTGQRSEIFR